MEVAEINPNISEKVSSGRTEDARFITDNMIVLRYENAVSLFDITARKTRYTIKHEAASSFAVSPDQSILAIGSGNYVTLWDIDVSQKLGPVLIHPFSLISKLEFPENIPQFGSIQLPIPIRIDTTIDLVRQKTANMTLRGSI